MSIEAYIEGTSLYHRFDTRPKLIFTLLYILLCFVPESPLSLLFILLLPFSISLMAVGKEAFRNILRVMPVVILLFLFSPFQARDGNPLLALSGVTILTEEGSYQVYRIAVRFVSIALILMDLLQTSRNAEIIKALRWFHMPYKAALSLSMMLRFIPHLAFMFSEIRDAMSLRLGEGKRGYPLLPSVTALTILAVRMIPESAAALEERGFGRKRTKEAFSYPGLYSIQMAISVIIPVILFFIMR